MAANWIQDMVADVEGLDDKTKKKLSFIPVSLSMRCHRAILR
jgi:hypothetical protein